MEVMDGRGARAGAGGDGEEMAGEVWQAQPAAASASRRPCTIVCPPVIVRPRRARRAGCGGWCREGKGRDAPGLGAFGGARAGPRRRGGARAERGQRGPSGAPCAHFHSAMPLCPLRRSHGGTQGFQPSRMFIIAPVRVLGCQGWRVLCVRRHSGLQTQTPQSASLCTCNACLFHSY